MNFASSPYFIPFLFNTAVLAGVRGQSSFVLGLSVAVERISPWPVFGNFSAKARQKLIFQFRFFLPKLLFYFRFWRFF